MVELRYCYPRVWAESVDVLGFLKKFLPPLRRTVFVRDRPTVAISVIEMDLVKHLPSRYAERWKRLQEQDHDYDVGLLNKASEALGGIAANMTSAVVV